MSEERQMNALQRLVIASRIAFKVARGNQHRDDPVFPRGMFGSLWSGPGFIGSLTQALSFGSFRGTTINYPSEVGELTSSSLCMAVWQYMATALTEAPPIVTAYEKGALTGEVVPDHPLVKLLQQPNEYTDGATLLMAFTLDWLFSGDSYWIKIFDRKYLTPVELWYVPYFMMAPLADERDRSIFIKEYQYLVEGYRYSYDPQEIVHIKRGINPRDMRHGIAVFDSVLRELYTDNQASNFAAVILKNHGILPFVLSPPKNSKDHSALKFFGDDPDKARDKANKIKTAFIEATTGDRRGEPIVNTIPLDITKLGFSPSELDISALRRVPESRVAAVTGLPAALLQFLVGLEFGTSYASYKEAREQAYESVIAPLLKIIASAINRQLLPDFGDPDGRRLEFSFDISGVRVLQEDQNKVFERADKGVSGGWMTVHDARSMTGLETDDTDKVYLRTSGMSPVPFGQLPEPTEPDKTEEDFPEIIGEETDKLMRAVLLKLLTEKNGNGNGHNRPSIKEIIVEGELIEDKGGVGSGNHGHAGRPGLVGGSAPVTALIGAPLYEQQFSEMEQQLRAIADFRSRTNPEGFKYASIEELVLKEGREFELAALPKGIKQGKLGLCFMNAYQTAEYHPEAKLGYAEGYAQLSDLPFAIAHAWNVDEDGNAVDPTFERYRRKGATITYYGVEIPMDQVRKTIFAREKYGVLHNPEQGFPILKNGLESKGGVGSGFFGHAGRPGLIGGSLAAMSNFIFGAPEEPTKPNELDRRLVDYKPDRSLSDPDTRQSIVQLLNTPFHTGAAHNARVVHYSQMPFLKKLHQEMGVRDASKIPIEKYVKLRDDFFSNLPLEEVPLDNIVATQDYVNRERVHEIREHPETAGGKQPYLVRYQGETYVINGHNRIAAEVLQFKPSIVAHVWDLGWEDEDKGGEGSGFHSHAGRPGKIGGSAPSLAVFNSGKDRAAIRGLFNSFYSQTIDKDVSEKERAALSMMAASIIRADTDANNNLAIHVVKKGGDVVGVAATELLPKGVREIHSMGSIYPSGGAKIFQSILQEAADDKVGLEWYSTPESDNFWRRTKIPSDGIFYKLSADEVVTLASGRRLSSMKSIDDWWPDANLPQIYVYNHDRIDTKGGEGSGFHGHAGRPGLVGGSAPESGAHPSQPIDTQTKYKINGQYTKERLEQVHNPVIEKMFANATPNDKRIVYFLGGGPASGKTSAVYDRLEKEGALVGAVRIDPDNVKTQIPEYQQLVKELDPGAGTYTHEESSDITKRALERANIEGYNVVYDTSGDNDIDKLEAKIAKMRRDGAKVINGEYTFLSSVDEALRRSNLRSQNPESDSYGRVVHEPLLRKMHHSVSRIFPEALKRGIFDNASLYNNDERAPRLVAIYNKEIGLKIIDQKLWDNFTAIGK